MKSAQEYFDYLHYKQEQEQEKQRLLESRRNDYYEEDIDYIEELREEYGKGKY